jgi:hypothetical protein
MSEKDTSLVRQQEAAGALAKTDFGEYAGKGFDNQTSNDMAIPFLGLLQALSPQLVVSDPKYIDGAEVGGLFNTVTQGLMDNPTFIVPCETQNVYVEWVPRDNGGGFVGIHTIGSDVVEKAKAEATAFNELKTPEGNDLMETFYIYALQLEALDSKASVSPLVLAFSSSKIKVYKRLMTQLRTLKGKPPMFAFRLAVTSCDDKNKKGQPFKNFLIGPACASLAESVNLPDNEFANLLEEGQALQDVVRQGLARAAFESQGGGVRDDANSDEVF